jgi:hypothetical protein
MKTAFEKWYEDADMPEKDKNGNWYDLETGLYYKEANYKSKVSDAAITNREAVKVHGAVALKGTVKQKNWAEKIRSEKIAYLSSEDASLLCDKNGLLTHSKFWIENRDRSSNEIVVFIKEQKSLLQIAKKLEAEKNHEEYEKIAAQYNDLTAKWGF